MALLGGQAPHQLGSQVANEALLLLQCLAVVVYGRSSVRLCQVGLQRIQDGLRVGGGNHADQDAGDGFVAVGEGLALDDLPQMGPPTQVEISSCHVHRGIGAIEVLPKRNAQLAVWREVVKDCWHAVILPLTCDGRST